MTAIAHPLLSKSVPDILAEFPQTEPVFQQFGLFPHYKALAFETLSASAAVNQVDLPALLKALDTVVSLPST